MTRRVSGPFRAEHARTQAGQAMPFFAIVLVGLLLFAGLAVDTGYAFVNRRDAQNAADLAALAGTKVIADFYVSNPGLTGADVYSQIATSVQENCTATGNACTGWSAAYVDNTLAPIAPVTNSGGIPGGAQGVQVTTAKQPPTFFLNLPPVNQTHWSIGATATALTASVQGLPPGQVLPIAANPPHNYTPGQLVNLTDGSMNGPGNFGWLSWSGPPSEPNLATSLCTPNNPYLAFPALVTGDPGQKNGKAVRACLQQWVTSGTVVYIPLWAKGPLSAPNQNCVTAPQGSWGQYCITALAAFVLTGFDQPAVDQITGRFVAFYTLPSVPAGYGGPPTPGSASYFLGLVK